MHCSAWPVSSNGSWLILLCFGMSVLAKVLPSVLCIRRKGISHVVYAAGKIKLMSTFEVQLQAKDLVFSAPGDKAGSSTIRSTVTSSVWKPGSSWTGTGEHVDSGGSIVFPKDSTENDRPKEPMPLACPGGQKFCQDEKAKEIISRHLKELPETVLERFDSFFGSENLIPVEDNALHTRIEGEPNEQVFNMCESEEKTEYPNIAESVDKKTKLILNVDGKYLQGIRTEVCRRPTNTVLPCQFSGVFPQGYRTECVQKWAVRKMVTVNAYSKDKNKSLGVAEFPFPSCCACKVIQTTSGTTSGRK